MSTATPTPLDLTRLTAPLPIPAAEALYRLELAFAPVLMSFPSPSGATVVVQAVGGDYRPYRWTCSAGCDGGGYASLPFCRDDAKAHAAECRTAPLSAEAATAVADYRKAALRAANLSNEALSPEMLTLHADDLAHAEDMMAGARATLAAAGRLDLIGGAS